MQKFLYPLVEINQEKTKRECTQSAINLLCISSGSFDSFRFVLDQVGRANRPLKL